MSSICLLTCMRIQCNANTYCIIHKYVSFVCVNKFCINGCIDRISSVFVQLTLPCPIYDQHQVCVCVCACVHACVRVYVCVYMCVCACMCVCVWVGGCVDTTTSCAVVILSLLHSSHDLFYYTVVDPDFGSWGSHCLLGCQQLWCCLT